MRISFLASILVIVWQCRFSNTSHILFLHQFASYSHIVASMPLAEALVSKGHNVTYISGVPMPSSNPKINYIVPQRLQYYTEAFINQSLDITNRLEGRMPNWFLVAEKANFDVCEVLLGSEEFQIWIKSTPTVDLIYIDNFPGPECGLGIGEKLRSKTAIFQLIGMNPKFFDTFGLPSEASSIPTWSSPIKTPMSLLDRIRNTLIPLGWRLSQLFNWGALELLIKNHLDIPHLPTIDELYQKVSLVLMNGHFIDEQRRSLPPLFVNAPGLHIHETHKPLTKEIQEFVDSKDEDGNPSEGFVYISFGTVVKAPNLPLNILEMFFNSIKAFPTIRFLWRWDGDLPQDKPKNLYLAKWFSQQDLLGNSKIRGFVTQSGRPSSQEALYNAVPLITFPILGDQDYNANMLEGLGVSINMEIGTTTEEMLRNAFSKILHDKMMKERCVEVSKLYKDLPMKPIDTAVFSTEYVLRHKNFSHLMPLAINQYWFQRRVLDVWAVVAISAFVSVLAIVYISRLIFKFTLAKLQASKNKLKQG